LTFHTAGSILKGRGESLRVIPSNSLICGELWHLPAWGETQREEERHIDHPQRRAATGYPVNRSKL